MRTTQTALGCPLLVLLLVLADGLSGANAARAANDRDWRARVDVSVLESARGGEVRFFVFLEEQADLSPVSEIRGKAERGAFVFERLTAVASRSQSPIVEALRGEAVEFPVILDREHDLGATFGWGRIDAFAAYQRALQFVTSAPVPNEGSSASAGRPNPFVAETAIRFSVRNQGAASLAIYDVTGRRVRTLVEETAHANGTFDVAWDGLDEEGRRFSAGTCFSRVVTGESRETARLTLLR